MCGTFCGVCQVYQNAESLGQNGEDIYMINFGCLKVFTTMLSGVLCCLFAMVLPCVPVMMLRQEAREKYNIEVRSWHMKMLPISWDMVKKHSFPWLFREAPEMTPFAPCAAPPASLARPLWRSRREETATRRRNSGLRLVKSLLHDQIRGKWLNKRKFLKIEVLILK